MCAWPRANWMPWLRVLEAESVHDAFHVTECEHLAADGVSGGPAVLRFAGQRRGMIRADRADEAALTVNLEHPHHVGGSVVVERFVEVVRVALNVAEMHEENLVAVAPLLGQGIEM